MRGCYHLAIQLGIGVHHRAHASFLDGSLEWHEIGIPQHARAHVDRCAVQTAAGQAVPDEVLGGRHDPLSRGLPLQAADVSHAKLRDQQRVFAKGLLDTPPARVAGDIEHRSQSLPCPDCQHLLADLIRHQLCQTRVPGACQSDHLRKDRPAQPQVS